MRLFRHYTEVPAEARAAVLALGNFDGLHRGHQAVIEEAARVARSLAASLGVVTFEPHPREFFEPDRPVFRLTPFRIKMRQLEAIGVDYVFVLHFDAGFAGKSAEAFVVEVLREGLDAAHVVVGYDFVFGRGRRGDEALLADLGRLNGFAVTSVPAAADEKGEVFSSTRVRQHLQAGRPLDAGRLLGRPWEIVGRVEPGDRRGRELGFPTANLVPNEYLRPAQGVYAVKAGIDEGLDTSWRDAVAYIGPRPTFGGEEVRLEVHVFDFAGELYGRQLRVALIDYLRADSKFAGLAELSRQIALDCGAARRRLAGYDGPPPGAAHPLPRRLRREGGQPGVYEGALRPRHNE